MTLQEKSPSYWQRFNFALPLTSVLAATTVRFCIPALGSQVPYITFFPAVVISALHGGVRGGVVASFLSAFAASFWIEPLNRPLIEKLLDLIGLVLFSLVAALLIYLCEGTRRARQQAEHALYAQAEALAAQRESARAEQVSHHRLLHVLESISDGFVVLDKEWNITYVNRQGAGIIGKTTIDLIGQNHWQKFPEAVGTPIEEAYCRATEEKQAVYIEEYYQPISKWVRLNIYPTEDGLSVFFQDITQQRQMEEERRELLEKEQAARQEAEVANRLKDEFLATLSHELRTPLNAILGWANILRSSSMSDEQMIQGLETIERNARAQTQIVNDILDMSAIISGKMRLDVQPVKLDEVIRAAIDTVQPAAVAKGIRIESILDPLAMAIKGDPNRLQQVLWNLLNNAIKFTPKNGKVQVSLERVNSHVEVCVTDTGQGIDPAFLPYVFDRFRQEDASSTRSVGGLGLGLSIVKHIAEVHGGTVRVKSRGLGHGATFIVQLPVIAVQVDGERREHPRAEKPSTAATSSPELKDMRVLVVDDAPDARELIEYILQMAGAEVVTATSSEEALGILTAGQFRPHVLVSDIGMPGEDGYQLMQRMRTLPQEAGGKIPAVALTAFARSEDRTRALQAGYQSHVAKPVEASELLAVMASLSHYSYRTP